MTKMMTDLETFMLDDGFDRIFRMYIFKRMFTPYEREKAYMDETVYTSSEPKFVKIREVIELPDKDVLLGYQEIFCWDDLDEGNPRIDYKKLSEIELSYYPADMKEENWD